MNNSRPDDPTHGGVNLGKAIIAGIAGGIVGTAVKTLCEIVSPPRPPGVASPLGNLLGMVSVMTTGHDMAPEVKTVAEKVVHWVFGIGAGVVYSVIAELVPAARVGRGAGFGVAFWIGLHEIALPLMKCSLSPLQMTAREQGNELVSHVLYGVGVESVRRWVRTKL